MEPRAHWVEEYVAPTQKNRTGRVSKDYTPLPAKKIKPHSFCRYPATENAIFVDLTY